MVATPLGIAVAADLYPFEPAFVGRVTDEVEGIDRTVDDFTSKPPGTIEWE